MATTVLICKQRPVGERKRVCSERFDTLDVVVGVFPKPTNSVVSNTVKTPTATGPGGADRGRWVLHVCAKQTLRSSNSDGLHRSASGFIVIITMTVTLVYDYQY